MGCRMFEITLNSAKNLEDVRRFRRMRVYATVSIGGIRLGRTPISNKRNETNPAWNFTIGPFTICESMVEDYNTMLVVKFYAERTLGDRYVGEVHRPMKELFDSATASGGIAVKTFPVLNGCGNSQGELKFSYWFGEKFTTGYKQFG